MLEALNLGMKYRHGPQALEGLNLRIESGEVFALIGANGAGKTTTIHLFLGFLRPTSGRALINGQDVQEAPLEAKRQVAFIPENVSLYGHLSARENLDFFTRIGGLQRRTRDHYHRALAEAGLQPEAFERKVKHFSKGMRQKLGIAIAVTRGTRALFLDEPTSGLDPEAAAEFVALLRRLKERGTAILMSTHDLFRAKDVADRVGIMSTGRMMLEKKQDELQGMDLEHLYLDYMAGGKRAE